MRHVVRIGMGDGVDFSLVVAVEVVRGVVEEEEVVAVTGLVVNCLRIFNDFQWRDLLPFGCGDFIKR